MTGLDHQLMGAIVLKVWLYLIEVKMMPMFKVLHYMGFAFYG
jgi:hypothetical protein